MGDLTEARRRRIRDLAEAATPGPWGWGGHNQSYGPIHLVSLTSCRPTVMGFKRLGMRSAQPFFFKRTPGEHPGWHGTFQSARDVAVQEVEYRTDIVDLDNADARFISMGPDVVLDLLDHIEHLEATITRLRVQAA